MNNFKVGDKVKRKTKYLEDFSWGSECRNEGLYPKGILTINNIVGESVGFKLKKNDGWLLSKFELVTTKEKNKMTKTKKVIRVLVVDKVTGETTKNEVVTAENEQQAILKAFGVDAEKVFIRTDEVGEFEEDKPIKAIIEKASK